MEQLKDLFLKAFIAYTEVLELHIDSKTSDEPFHDENNQISYKESEIDEKIGLSNSLGFYIGIGIRIPISRFDLIVKPDYKFGINKLYSYQDEIFNRYFRINIGLRINKQMSKPRIDNG